MEEMGSQTYDKLLDMVAVIAPEAHPTNPHKCWMRQFNAARGESPFPDAPTANAIHLALNKHARTALAWSQIVELAFADPADREPVLRAAHRTEEQDWLTRRHLYYALNRVARELGKTTLIPADYRAGRAALIRRERRRDPESEIAELLPTEGQIERIARGERNPQKPSAEVSDWDYALQLADLAPREERARSAARKRESRRITAAQAAAIFGAVNDRLPSKPTLTQFGAQTSLKFADTRGVRWDAVLDEASAMLADAGVPVPPRPKPMGRGSVVHFKVPEGPLGIASGGEMLSREQAVEVVRVWDREQSGSTRTQRGYQAWQKGSRYPGMSTLQRVAPFSDLTIEAMRLNSAGAPPRCELPGASASADFSADLLRRIASAPSRDMERSRNRERSAVYRGPRPWLSDLIAAGLLSIEESLVARYRGTTHTARVDAEGNITVDGHDEQAATLARAKELISGSKNQSWTFWTVEREGQLVPLARLRDQITSGADRH